MPRQIMDEIRKEISENRIILYMKGSKHFPQCGFSAATVEVLKSLNADFKEVDVLADQEKWQAIKEFSDWPTIPQLYVDGQFIGGCDIVREMHAKGELEPLVRKGSDKA